MRPMFDASCYHLSSKPFMITRRIYTLKKQTHGFGLSVHVEIRGVTCSEVVVDLSLDGLSRKRLLKRSKFWSVTAVLGLKVQGFMCKCLEIAGSESSAGRDVKEFHLITT